MITFKVLSRVARAVVDKRQPVFAHLCITERCNLRCRFCKIWSNPARELGTENFCKIIDTLDRMGVADISIAGGEPLLRKDVYEIIDHSSRLGIYTQITSNGLMPLSSYQRLLETGIDRIAISLDQVHGEDLPYSHTSRRIIQTIEYLLANKGQKLVAVSSVLHTENKDHISEVIDFCKKKGIGVFVQPAVTGKGHLRVDRKEQLDGIISSDDILNPSYFNEAAQKYVKEGRLLWGCRAGQLFFDVKPDGHLWLCHDYPTELNLLDPDFEQEWLLYDFKSARTQCTDGCIYGCYIMTQKGLEPRNLSESLRSFIKSVSIRPSSTNKSTGISLPADGQVVDLDLGKE